MTDHSLRFALLQFPKLPVINVNVRFFSIYFFNRYFCALTALTNTRYPFANGRDYRVQQIICMHIVNIKVKLDYERFITNENILNGRMQRAE